LASNCAKYINEVTFNTPELLPQATDLLLKSIHFKCNTFAILLKGILTYKNAVYIR